MLFAALLLALATPADAAATSSIDGTWTVDLSPAGDGSYTKPMVLVLAEDGALTGEFYDTAISAGRWAKQNGRICVSFETSDGSGIYAHSACSSDGNAISGQSWSKGRNFLFMWSAKR